VNPVCRQIRKDILQFAKASGHGHIPTCFSVVEALYAIYSTIRHDPKNPSWDGRDLFVLSKGHASLAHYCVLAEFGYFEKSALSSFGAFQSRFGCHADRLKVPGIEASTGSLGHGINLAVGMALACRIKHSNRRVYTLIGDGEANEGSVWEALLVAINLGLDNLTVLYDNNMSHSRGLQIHDPANHFRGFGCETVEVNGHDVDELNRSIIERGERVRVVVAHTKKGQGCRTLIERHYEWHRRSPNEREYSQLMEELCEEAV
jgi:transketolase